MEAAELAGAAQSAHEAVKRERKTKAAKRKALNDAWEDLCQTGAWDNLEDGYWPQWDDSAEETHAAQSQKKVKASKGEGMETHTPPTKANRKGGTSKDLADTPAKASKKDAKAKKLKKKLKERTGVKAKGNQEDFLHGIMRHEIMYHASCAMRMASLRELDTNYNYHYDFYTPMLVLVFLQDAHPEQYAGGADKGNKDETKKKRKRKASKKEDKGETGDGTYQAAPKKRLLKKGRCAESDPVVPCTCYHAITHHYPAVNPTYNHISKSDRMYQKAAKSKEEIRYKGVRVMKDYEGWKIRYYMTWQDENNTYRRGWCNVMGDDPDATFNTVKNNIKDRLAEGYIP